jgi:hypothetical protein
VIVVKGIRWKQGPRKIIDFSIDLFVSEFKKKAPCRKVKSGCDSKGPDRKLLISV